MRLTLIIILFSYLIINSQTLLGAGPSTRSQIRQRVGVAFPVVSTLSDLAASKNDMIELGSKTVRIAENWKTREPSENVFSWAGLDAKIDTFATAGIRIMVTVEADGPSWRCSTIGPRSCVYSDLQPFKDYITTLCRRYRGRIQMMQFGNEAYSSYWYVGTTSNFIAATNAFDSVVRAEMPGVRIALAGAQNSLPHAFAVCNDGKLIPTFSSSTGALLTAPQVATWCADPTITTMQSNFLTIVAGSRYDVLDIHLYDNMEYWDQYMSSLRSRLPGRTWIATELGCPNKRYELQDDNYHASRVSLLLSTQRTLGFQEAYYFQLLEYNPASDAEHEKSGLLRYSDRSHKPAFDTLKLFNNRYLQ
jgi:putative glycosyl hydrolase/glycosyl hydrolase family 42 (putative beta-galactosidase)